MTALARPRALVLLNPGAGQGRARGRYERVRGAIEARFDARLVEVDPHGSAIARELRDGTRVFIAAGGDGTVGTLADRLVASRGRIPLSEIALGAVGLGSSNDFHKPVRNRILGVPVRIDLELAVPRDLGRARYLDERGESRERRFVVSASLGLVAQANASFNRGAPPIAWLKRRWVDAAIACSALGALVRHRGVPVRLAVGGVLLDCRLGNLSVMKTPHLAGGLRYDTPVRPDDGLLAVNLCERRSRLGLLLALGGLARGRFAGRPGARVWLADCVEVDVEAEAGAAPALELELDGEIVSARRVRFDLWPERMMACR
jgi:diacylglycerol kinase (ATP)